MLLIGIDEAGYGPRIGPLCHGYSAIRCRDAEQAPDLWSLLHPTVMRVPGFEGSTLVDDSKKINGVPNGRELLARGVLAFLICMQGEGSVSECAEWLDLYEVILPESDRVRLEQDAWANLPPRLPSPDLKGGKGENGDGDDGTAAPLAEIVDATGFEKAVKTKRVSKKVAALGPAPDVIPPLRERLNDHGISVVAVGARGMSARHYNMELAALKNKADVNWSVIAEQFLKLLKLAQPGEPVHAVIDRQGGRKFYAAKIGELFPGAMPWVEVETPTTSVYRIETGDRVVRLKFMVDADGQALTVALGSMAAKLARELCMHRLNTWFRQHVPELKPTAGYYGDASRFLRETKKMRKTLGIANAAFVRVK